MQLVQSRGFHHCHMARTRHQEVERPDAFGIVVVRMVQLPRVYISVEVAVHLLRRDLHAGYLYCSIVPARPRRADRASRRR